MGGCRGIVPLGVASGIDYYPGGVTVTDPYASYQTWYVDPTFGDDSGVHNPAGWIYATHQQALQDVFYAPNLDGGKRRIIMRSSALWNGGSPTPYTYLPAGNLAVAAYPASGSVASGTPTFNYVLQGDPASNVLPFISGGYDGTVGVAGRNFMDIAHSNTTIGFTVRKLQLQDFSATAIHVASSTTAYLQIEYCYFKNFYYNGGDSSAGGFAHPFHQSSSNWLIQHCKFENFGLLKGNSYPDSTPAHYGNENCSSIETYGANNVTITNCSFVNTVGAINLKLANQNPNHTDNWNVTNNVFTGCRRGIFQNSASGNFEYGSNNWIISGNLSNGTSITTPGALTAPTGAIMPGFPGSNITFVNNTVGETVSQGFAWWGATTLGGTVPGLIVKDNIWLCPKQSRITADPSDTYFGADSASVFSYCDYNVYGPSANQWQIDWHQTLFRATYQYTTFAQWQAANTTPLGPGAPTPPADFAVIGNPDPNGRQLANLADFPNSASGDYTLAGGSPLLTASSTGGRVGYDPTNSGPGW
jgi:hypothetical protein